MDAWGVFWLRIALLLYSVGLWHALVTVVQQRPKTFLAALTSISVGFFFHAVSVCAEVWQDGSLPVRSIYEMASLTAFLITGVFLWVYWKFRYESVAVFVFPIVFLLTLVGSLGVPLDPWLQRSVEGGWWLSVHVALILLGFAALFLTFIAGIMYLIQEHELKSKKPRAFYYRLPPLRTLDQVLHQTMAFGFISVTLGLIVASVYAASHWGTNWIVDPTIALAFATWAIYLAMTFSRVAIGWRGRKSAYFAIAGFCGAALTWIANSGAHRVHAAMSVLILGLSHKTAPVEVRERFALPEGQAEALLASLAGRPGIEEACILSACNRVEFMVRGDDFEGPETALLTFLNEDHRAPVVEATPFLYRYADREAIRHIFRVASSLDSMVVGEPQILGQVKTAYQAAKQAGAIRGPLDHLLTAAFRVARRVRNETGIGQMAVSISYVAVELARKIFGDLQGLNVLIIGAGKMSELTARHLSGAGAKKPFVVNRTFEKAQEMAKVFGGEAVPYDRLHELLVKVDVVISSTGAPGFVLTKESLSSVAAARKGRPLFLVDIAVPRDIDPEMNKLDEMFVYDIDDLQQVAEANMKQRRKEAELAEQIVDEEVEATLHRIRGHMVNPTIISLQKGLDELRQAEIERFRAKLGELTPEQEQAIDGLTRGLVRKIAHTPITEMKAMAGRPDGERFVEFVKRAFNLIPR